MKNRTGRHTDLVLTLKGGCFVKKGDWKKWEHSFVENAHILKPKVVEKREIPYVCLDTNVVIDLANLYFKEKRDHHSKSNSWSLKKLQKYIQEGKVKAIVTPYVLQEIYFGLSKYGDNCLRYMKENNIFVLELPKVRDVYYFEGVEMVALRYCGRCKSPYAKNPKEGRKREDQIFPLAYEDKILRPNIDSRIMAEASILGCPLLTNNIGHFIAENKDAEIERINKQAKQGEYLRPYKPSTFLSLFDVNYKFPNLKYKYKNNIKLAKDAEL